VQILAGPPGYALAAFSVPDIEAALEALRAEGLCGPEPAFVVGEVKFVFVRDPDGIMVEVIELPDGAKVLADL
jgi:catechol 2,3-dioxygenase-like lactoylglutathione lyase family enzyme